MPWIGLSSSSLENYEFLLGDSYPNSFCKNGVIPECFYFKFPKKMTEEDLNAHMDRKNLDAIFLPKVLQALEETIHVNLLDLECSLSW